MVEGSPPVPYPVVIVVGAPAAPADAAPEVAPVLATVPEVFIGASGSSGTGFRPHPTGAVQTRPKVTTIHRCRIGRSLSMIWTKSIWLKEQAISLGKRHRLTQMAWPNIRQVSRPNSGQAFLGSCSKRT